MIAINMLYEEQLVEKENLRVFAFFHDSSQMMVNLNEMAIVLVCWLTVSWNARFENGQMLKRLSWLIVGVPVGFFVENFSENFRDFQEL
jgi:hypothetical protein